MVKRKVSTNGDVKGSKKTKNEKPGMGKLQVTTPGETFGSLLGKVSIETFMKENWEQKFLHIKREDQEYYGSLFSLEGLKEIVEEEELFFERDINCCRYVDGEKELLNEGEEISLKDLNELLDKKKATLQFHQPQRFEDGLWNLMEKLETHFNSLVGANVYITPAESQGLAPHCDDVEIFVLQLEGKKTWKLYEPHVKLSRDYTQDLLQDAIGEPIYECTLEPGDMLYFPRGTIHQAKTFGDSHSTHISMSTFQNHCVGDFMDHAVRMAIENAMEDDVTFRQGLPLNYRNILGTQRDMSKYVEDDKEDKMSNEKDTEVMKFKERIKDYLSKLVDHIDVNKAADSMSSDFIGSRLPPFGHAPPEVDENEAEPPTLDCQIKMRYPEHVRVMYLDEDTEDDEDDELEIEEDDEEGDESMEQEEEEKKPAKGAKKNGKEEKDEKPSDEKTSSAKKTKEKRRSKTTSEVEDDEDNDQDAEMTETEYPCIAFVHSLNNERDAHMCGPQPKMDPSMIKLPVHFARAANFILNSKDFVKVKDIPDLEEDNEKLLLATSLFADDIIEMKF